MSDMNREHLLNLAAECDAGADALTYAAEHAEVLARCGYPDADWQEWAARQASSAEAVREYAAGLRAEAAGMIEGQSVPEARIREAEKVAQAANLGGILIDGRPPDDATRAETAAIEGSGLFELVAEEARCRSGSCAAPPTTTGLVKRNDAGTGSDSPLALPETFYVHGVRPMSVEIPAGLLAQVDREKVHTDACLDGLIGTARRRIAEHGDTTMAWAAMVASLSNAGAQQQDACLLAAAAVRLAQLHAPCGSDQDTYGT